MCLYTKQICPLRARKDIVCYKAFTNYGYVKGMMKTPYLKWSVYIPTTEPTVMEAIPKNHIEKNQLSQFTYEYLHGSRFLIKGGMIHAFCDKELIYDKESFVLFKCIIPKGTLYYKGRYHDICAKKMIVVEQVK